MKRLHNFKNIRHRGSFDIGQYDKFKYEDENDKVYDWVIPLFFLIPR